MLILAHFRNFKSSFPQPSREVSHQTPNPSTPDEFGVLSRELIIMFSHKKGGLSKVVLTLNTPHYIYYENDLVWEGVYFEEF